MDLAICVVAICIATVLHKAIAAWVEVKKLDNEWADEIEVRVEALEEKSAPTTITMNAPFVSTQEKH